MSGQSACRRRLLDVCAFRRYMVWEKSCSIPEWDCCLLFFLPLIPGTFNSPDLVWNPLLFLPWVVWGIIDWGFYAPVLCNLICMTAGVVIFAWFAMPRPRQAVVMAIMLSTFTPLTRFVLSSVAEVFFMSLILIYAGLFLAYKREHKEGYIHVLLYLTIFLTIMRAYYCLLILLLWINISAKIEWSRKVGG